MPYQNIITLVIGLTSILGSIITVITFFNFIKFRLEIMEKRVEELQSKEIPEIRSILNSEMKEIHSIIKKLEESTGNVAHQMEILNLKFELSQKPT